MGAPITLQPIVRRGCVALRRLAQLVDPRRSLRPTRSSRWPSILRHRALAGLQRWRRRRAQGLAVVTAFLANPAFADSAGKPPAKIPPQEAPIAFAMNGDYLANLNPNSISLEPISSKFTIFLRPALGKRRRCMVEGVDRTWREMPCAANFAVRYLSADGDLLSDQLFPMIGESRGWNGSLERPVFVHRQEVLTAPPQTRSAWIVISSAGPPETLGTILVKRVSITRLSSSGRSETILRVRSASIRAIRIRRARWALSRMEPTKAWPA